MLAILICVFVLLFFCGMSSKQQGGVVAEFYIFKFLWGVLI